MIIKAKVYNKLAEALAKQQEEEKALGFGHRYPYLFLLASKDGKIINALIQLKHNSRSDDRCYRMSNLSAKEMIRGSLDLMRKGYRVVGLARVGCFHRPGWNHNDGSVRSELGTGMLFVTVEPEYFTAERVNSGTERVVIIR